MQGLRLTAMGLAIGMVGALATGRLMTALLYETQPYDPAAYLGTISAVLAAAGLACLLPARRAALADPVGALRGAEVLTSKF